MADEITGAARGLEALLASGPLGATVGALLWWIWRKDALDRERSKAAGDRADARERDHAKALADQRAELLAELRRKDGEIAALQDKRALALERMAEVMRLTLDTVTRRATEAGKEKRNASDTRAGQMPGLGGGGDAGGPGA